jgi:hypothetical protein
MTPQHPMRSNDAGMSSGNSARPAPTGALIREIQL